MSTMKIAPMPTTLGLDWESCIMGSADQNVHASHSSDSKSMQENLEGWTFFESLSKISNSDKETCTEKENSCDPHRKSSFPRLSERSLELCTENLGSETGSDSIFSWDSFDSLLENSTLMQQQQRPNKQCMKSSRKKITSSHSFPPPLTTISGSRCLQMRPYRENGRLIMKAVKAPIRHSCLQAERSHGRLRLFILQDCDSNHIMINEEETEQVRELNNEDHEVDIEETESEEEEEEEEEDGDEEFDAKISHSTGDVEMGMETFQRPSRCKEGGNGTKELCNWKSAFWAAIS